MIDSSSPPDVVVLVPTINNVLDLKRCLAALGRQTYSPFRTVIVDGCSTDGTREVVERHGATYLEDHDSTRADALNNALRRTEGDIIVFTDDDCYPPPEWLALLMRHFERADVAGVGGPNVAPPDQTFWGRVADVAFSARFLTSGTRYGKTGGPLRQIGHNSGCNAAYRKHVLEEAGGFPAGSIGGEDVVLDHRITTLGHKLWYDPEAITFHRRRDTLGGLARMGRSYGRGRGHVNARHPEVSHPAHKLPMLAVLGLLTLVVVSALATLSSLTGARPFWTSSSIEPWRVALIAMPGLAIVAYYAIAVFGAATGGSRYRTPLTVVAAPAVLALIHGTYGLGYLQAMREVALGRLDREPSIGKGMKVRGR